MGNTAEKAGKPALPPLRRYREGGRDSQAGNLAGFVPKTLAGNWKPALTQIIPPPLISHMQRGAVQERDEGDLAPMPPGPAAGHAAPYLGYGLAAAFDEMFARDATVRPTYAELDARLRTLPAEELARRQAACEQSFLHQGITFTVYSDAKATERIIPTDLIPRIVTGAEWARVEAGLKQRITALNLFLRDIYNDGRVLKDGVVPRSMIYGSKNYRREMRGLPVPHGAYVNIC